MKRYKAVLFAPDGDWVIDFEDDTISGVIEQLANKGSLWYFYPFEGIILDKGRLTNRDQRLVDVAPNIPRQLVGKSIRTMSKWLSNLSEGEICCLLSGG